MSDERDSVVPDVHDTATPEHGTAAAKPVSRRAALKVIGTVPIAGAMMGSSAFAQGVAGGAQQPKQTHEAPFPPEQGQGPTPRSAPKRAFFTAAEWRTVSVLADDIIPRDGRSGSATDAGVPAFIDYHLSVPESSEESRTAIRGGLAWLNTESRKRFRRSYATLSPAQRHQILDDIAWPKKAKPEFSHGVSFFTRMRDLVGMGFFSSSIGWRDLQYQGNVFNPEWKGCPDEAMKKLGVSHALMDTRVKVQY